MMADRGVRWNSIVQDHGVLLTEMGSMDDLFTPIKSYSRIKYTCMTASKKHIAMGSSTGGLYIFDRRTLKHNRFISNKDGAINMVCLSANCSLLGAATSNGIVLVWEVAKRRRDKPKFIRRSEEHKDARVTALCWDENETCLFAGDDKGVVSVVRVPLSSKHSLSANSHQNKGLALFRSTQVVAKAQTPIVQLDLAVEKLLVSTINKTAVVNLTSLDCVSVGVKPRDGLYGSCFFKDNTAGGLLIYSARPGSRLWEASIDGQVMATQQYKNLLAKPPVPLLGHGHNSVVLSPEKSFRPQSVNFAKLQLVRSCFLVTWCGSSLYIMDPALGQLVSWYAWDTEIQDVCCIGNELYVYDTDHGIRWFALLSVKECLSKLYIMGEIEQCLKVLIDCKHYIIPASARDLVPISMITSLKESLSKEQKQEVFAKLDELEHDMEPDTYGSDDPPTYHGNGSLIDSPDTLSVFSDDQETFSIASDPGMLPSNEAADTPLEVRHSVDRTTSKASSQRKGRKQWSAEVSLESILMTAAAAAKKLTPERYKDTLHLKRTRSADGSVSGRSTDNSSEQVSSEFIDTCFSESNSQSSEAWMQMIKEEDSAFKEEKKELEISPYHSDESESRQSGNEGAVTEEEPAEKKEKLHSKEKRKKKKRVVTVDIDSPHFRQGQELSLIDSSHAKSSSFLGTYSAGFDITEVRNRRLSEPQKPFNGTIQLEITPAIPAMLSKAKGLLKKKLMPADDGVSTYPPSPNMEHSVHTDPTPDNSAGLKCPPEVEELIQCSADTRIKVKSPEVLFSIKSLLQTLEEWIPKLHAAMNCCQELHKINEQGTSEISLRAFLDDTALDNVSCLVRMCFDTAVYGLHHLQDLPRENIDRENALNSSLHSPTCVDVSHGDVTIESASKTSCSNGDYVLTMDQLQTQMSQTGVLKDTTLGASYDDAEYGTDGRQGQAPYVSCDGSHYSVSHGATSRGDMTSDVTDDDNLSCASYKMSPCVISGEAEDDGTGCQSDVSTSGLRHVQKDLLRSVSIKPTDGANSVASLAQDLGGVNAEKNEIILYDGGKGDTVPPGNNIDCDNAVVQGSDDMGSPGAAEPIKENAVYQRDEEERSTINGAFHCQTWVKPGVQTGQEYSGETVDNKDEKNLVISKEPKNRGLDVSQEYELECNQCQTERTSLHGHSVITNDVNIHERKELDAKRSRFLSCYFPLLDVKQIRRTLHMSRGDRSHTWRTLVDCLKDLVTADDVISRYINEGDTRRALHELHDETENYTDTLLYHLKCVHESDSREAMVACARMFPDVHPWEVLEMCRQCRTRSLESRAADFVLYVEQLMRWRSEAGMAKEQTVRQICEDMVVTEWWFHCALIANSPKKNLQCPCGLPRPGSHTLTWQHADHLGRVIDFLQCQKAKKSVTFMDLCWKHGYWTGLIRLYVRADLRKEAMELVVHLGDLKLIKDPQGWGQLPKFLHEWRHLLELVLAPCHHDSEENEDRCVLASSGDSHWTPDLTWDSVIHLMLDRLGAEHTVKLLMAQSLDTPPITKDFYYSCLLGTVVERQQRTLIHEMLKKLDSYLWSQRSGSLAPKLQMFCKEEQTSGPSSKEDAKPQLESIAHFRTLEDGASNWGQSVRLSDAQCLVCSLQLCEQISSSNQGVLLFECGHLFHKHCVPERACVVCFQQNLKTIGEKFF